MAGFDGIDGEGVAGFEEEALDFHGIDGSRGDVLLHGERCAIHPVNQSERWAHVALLRVDDPVVADMIAALADDLCRLAQEER